MDSLRKDLAKILKVEEEQVEQIQSEFLRKQAREIRRMAEVES